MRFRILAMLAAAVTLALAGCGDSVPGVSLGEGNGSQPATVTIDSAAGLKAALEAAGIQNVHPVNTDNGTLAAWAVMPKFKRCPILFEVGTDGKYNATQLQKPDKSRVNPEGLGPNADAAGFALWAVTNANLLNDCAGDTPPAEADWPKTV